MIEVGKEGIMKHFNRVCYRFLEEREAQIEKWGIQHHSFTNWLVILMGEVGEASKEALESVYMDGRDNFNIKIKNYEKELIQCGAVVVAILEDLYDTFPEFFEQEKRIKKSED